MHKFQSMNQRLVTTVLDDAREKRFLIHCEVSIRDPHKNGWIERGEHKHLLTVMGPSEIKSQRSMGNWILVKE